MNRARLGLFFLTCCMAACAENSGAVTDAGHGASGGTEQAMDASFSGGVSQAGRSGSGGSGGGTVGGSGNACDGGQTQTCCFSLRGPYLDIIARAQNCVPGGTNQCVLPPEFLVDTCSCRVPVNGSATDLAQAQALLDAALGPNRCQFYFSCGRTCPQQTTPACIPDSQYPSQGRCGWAMPGGMGGSGP